MDLKGIVSEALDTFEVQVATEYLRGRDGLRGAPDNFANHTASRKAAQAWGEQYFKICAVRSSRGRHVRTAQSTATSELRLMAAIEQKAIGHRFTAGPSNPVWDVLDLSKDAVVEVRRQCYAVFWKHEMNTTLLELDRRYQEQVAADSSSHPKESASDTTGTPSDEGISQPATPSLTPTTETEVAPWPATSSSPSQEDPQSFDQPLQVFTWTNWKGEIFSSDYSEAYKTPAVAQCTLSRKPNNSADAAHRKQLAPASQLKERTTAGLTVAPCHQDEPLRERGEGQLPKAATSSGDTSGSQGKAVSSCVSDRVRKPLPTWPTISPEMISHHDPNRADRRLFSLPVVESESNDMEVSDLPLVLVPARADTAAEMGDTSSPVEETSTIQTPDTGTNESLSGDTLVGHAKERTVSGTVARFMGEMGDEACALAAGFCMAAVVRWALLSLP